MKTIFDLDQLTVVSSYYNYYVVPGCAVIGTRKDLELLLLCYSVRKLKCQIDGFLI